MAVEVMRLGVFEFASYTRYLDSMDTDELVLMGGQFFPLEFSPHMSSLLLLLS